MPAACSPPPPRRLTRRLTQLYLGLVLYGVSMALFVRSDLGVMPWDVLHQGLTRRLGLTLGLWTILIGVVVLLLWIPLRERPGVGTISNALLVGLVVDLLLPFVPHPGPLAARIGVALAGLLLNGLATALYIGARLGAGPRDGLMTGLVQRTGRSVRLVRTSIEVAVVLVGWLLGGALGFATAAYALGIGPIVQVLLPRLTVRLPPATGGPALEPTSGRSGDPAPDTLPA